jgi:hypothetical protein
VKETEESGEILKSMTLSSMKGRRVTILIIFELLLLQWHKYQLHMRFSMTSLS